MVKGFCCFGVPFWLNRLGLFGGHPTPSLSISYLKPAIYPHGMADIDVDCQDFCQFLM